MEPQDILFMIAAVCVLGAAAEALANWWESGR